MHDKKFFFIFSLLFFIGCNNPTSSTYTIKEITPISNFSLLNISSAEEAVGYLAGFIVTDSLLIVADFQGNDLVYFTNNGAFIKRIGRPGKGPADFNGIKQIFHYSNFIVVDDFGNRRLQMFSLNGEFIRLFNYATYVINSGVKRQASAFDSEGNYYLTTNGFQSEKMIKKFDTSFSQLLEFGELESTELLNPNPFILKSFIKKRRLHPSTKNNVLLISSSDSSIYMIHLALPQIKKYTLNGELIFNNALKLNDLKEYRTEYFKKAEELIERNVFKNFWYWHDVTSDERGGLYLLFSNLEQMTIYHINKSGNIDEKLIGPNDEIVNIYYEDGILWAYSRENQKFYSFKLN